MAELLRHSTSPGSTRRPRPTVAKRREHTGQLEVSDRDRALLELAAEHDRERDA